MDILDDKIDAFLTHCQQRNFSTHTLKAYRGDLRQFTRFMIAQPDWGDLTTIGRTMLRAFAGNLHHYQPRTQRRKLATISSLFAFLEEEGRLECNPIRNLRFGIRVGRILPRTISFAKLKAVFKAAYRERNAQSKDTIAYGRAVRDVALLELLFSSGMRVSEISNLRVEMVDLERAAVLVRGKGNKERLIPLCDGEVRSALSEYVRQQPLGPQPHNYFFRNRFGARLSEQSIRGAIRRYGKSAGVEKLTPHVFRHTVATMLLERGVDLRFIQQFLGHNSIVTTTIYVHVTEKSQRKILKRHHPRQLLGKLVDRFASETNEG